MIYKQCILTIANNDATLDEDIYLYRLDKNVELYFTIVNNKYKFDKSDLNNIISLTNASYFQMRLYKDKDVKYTFAIQPTENGQAILTITDDLIDEPIEVGDYDFQISLLDADKSSMISMPIARQQLHVCEPLVSNESKTGSAVLGLSQLDTAGEIIDAFDENGNYIRKVHVNGETISAELFNKWETALESNTTNIVEVKNNQINLSKDITNLSLAIGDDGLLYIKKRNGTLIGTGVKVNTDLSNITMSLNANTLILSNNGTQIASVDLPSSVSDADVSNLITKGVSETNYNALDTTDKRIIGGINEINTHLNGTAKKTIVEGNKIYLVKSDGTKLDKGTELPTSEPAKPYDDTSIKSDISNIKNDLGTAQLTTTAQNVKGAINEIDAQCKNIASRTITTEERTKLTNLKNYDDTSIKADVNNIKADLGTAELTTTAKDLKGAINEVNKKLSDIPTLFTTEQTDDYYKIKYNNIVIATIPLNSSTPTPTTKYSITNNLSHATNSNSATSIEKNASYNATITANSNYRIKTVTVIMYGTDITDSVYSGGRIIIDNVVGDIVITVTTELINGGDEDLSKLDGILKDRLLVWHDEFDDATLDTSKWRYATHNSGGSEQQAYTMGRTENVRLENSNLILEARKDGYINNWTWSSGRIDTSGLAGFKYGRLEAKLKYDVVSGAFPAFWTIGTCAHYPTGENIHGVQKSKGTQWAQNGEIDMFEGRGTNSEIAQGGWYNQDDGKGNLSIIFGRKNIDASQYHVYAVEWTETTMISYIDGVETGRTDISNIESWHRPMYIILNMAVGSTGGYPADDCTSIKMEVDWVRVYAPVGVTEKTEVQSISLSQNNLSFNMGDDPIDVYYTVNPSTAWDNNVNYESNNTSVATVFGSRITPVGVGNCKITARATNGVTATINVTVAENANINAKSITLNKDTLEIYNGTSSTLIPTVTPANHTDSILWKTANPYIATVENGVVTGVGAGTCNITAYSSADETVQAKCAVTVKEAVQLKGHPTSGLTLQLDRNGMSSTSWTNAVDNTKLQWKVANNNSPDIAAYMKFDGNSFYWEGTDYKDHLTLDGFKNYYDFGESQTVILAGDFTNVLNPIISNKAKISQNANLACMNSNGITYSDASGKRIGAINLSTSEQNYNINGCISLRYNKQTLRVDTDTMEFTGSIVNNKNVTLSSAFTQGSYPALLGNVSTAKAYFKVVLVYNRVLTDAEIGTTMNAITTFLNS